MTPAYLHKFLTNPSTKTSNRQKIFWLTLSLTFATIYSLLAIQQAFVSEYVIQDDARQHVFWMQRFVDPQLFPQDLIADYFQSVSPPGYTAVYQFMAVLGVSPILLSKVLPLVLIVITTVYFFGLCLEIFPFPATGFIASLLLSQMLWRYDDLISATSRAFLYPLFIAFLYYLLRRSLLPCILVIVLLGLCYPPYVLVCAGIIILQLFKFVGGWPRLVSNRSDRIFCGVVLIVCVAVLLPLALTSSSFGPVVSLSEARNLPEFFPKARSSFFNDNDPFWFWLHNERSGFRFAFIPPIVALGLLLPVLFRFPSRFPLVQQISTKASILLQIIIVSITLFLSAHALLFKLYLPSRYTTHTIRIVIALATAIAITTILDAIFQLFRRRSFLAFGITVILGTYLIFYPHIGWKDKFPENNYVIGQLPELYQFLQKQPKDTLIASLTEEVSVIPSFAQRSILVSREHAIPYHLGYYRKFRHRLDDLIHAQYSPNLAEVQKFIANYGIDFWLLDNGAFTPDYMIHNRWLKQYQTTLFPDDPLVNTTTEAQQNLQRGSIPALSKIMSGCVALETKGLILLDAKCITSQ